MLRAKTIFIGTPASTPNLAQWESSKREQFKLRTGSCPVMTADDAGGEACEIGRGMYSSDLVDIFVQGILVSSYGICEAGSSSCPVLEQAWPG